MVKPMDLEAGGNQSGEPSGATPLRDASRLEDKGEISDGYHTFNELYEHRHALFAVASAFHGGWKSKLHDDGSALPGWFIAGISGGEEAVTYHLPMRHWNRFPGRELDRAPKWDGYTSDDVIGRLWTIAHSLSVPLARSAPELKAKGPLEVTPVPAQPGASRPSQDSQEVREALAEMMRS